VDEKQFNNIDTIVSTVVDLLNSIDDPIEKRLLCEKLIFEIMNWGLDNIYEQLGILEKIKSDFIHSYYTVEEDDASESSDEEL